MSFTNMAKTVFKPSIFPRASLPQLPSFFHLACFLLFALCTINQTAVTGVIITVAAMVWLLSIVFYHPLFILKYLVFIFAIVANIAGVFVCEYGAIYLEELTVYTEYVGSLHLIVFSRMLFLGVLLFFDQLLVKRIESLGHLGFRLGQRENDMLTWLVYLTLGIGIVLLLDAARDAPAFLLGRSRFSWSTMHDSFIPSAVSSNYVYMMVFPSLAFFNGKKKLGIVTLLVYIAYLLWTGVKFGGIFTVVCIFIVAAVPTLMTVDVSRLRRVVLYAGFAAVLMIAGASLIHITYTSKGGTTASPFEYVFERTAQQGQLWWRTYQITEGMPHVEEFGDEIALWGSRTATNQDNVGASTGIARIMYLTTPKSIVDRKLAGGSSYTESGYASMYYYFGLSGPIVFSIIAGILAALLMSLTIRALCFGWLIDALVAIRICPWGVHKMLGMTSWSIFGFLSLISFAYLILSGLIRVNGGSQAISKRSFREPVYLGMADDFGLGVPERRLL